MIQRYRAFLGIGVALLFVAGIVVAIKLSHSRAPWAAPPLTLEGAVLTQNVDPGQRTPLSGVIVTATGDSRTVVGKSDSTGYFHLTLNPGLGKGQQMTLLFKKLGYKDLQMVATKPGDQLYVEQMAPLESKLEAKRDLAKPPPKLVSIANVRVRYSFKDESTISVGTIAKQFPAFNNGNVPCRGRKPCSPDGRWEATVTTLPLDADQGNEFRNVRVSCIAGPCRFSRIESGPPDQPTRRISISVLNWSDTTDFLVEADVVRTMNTESVRLSYPYILEDTMNFALPPNSEGPVVEADLNGEFIVFPLGPDVLLSWATCTVDSSPNANRIFRCRLKPGYQF